jgi:dolichol-phosphate mannosyltransferase
MIAYVIRFFTIFGQSEFWIRVPAFLGWLFFLFFAYMLTKKIYQNKKVAYLAVLITLFTPLVATGGHIMTTDIPMIFWASFTWYFLYMAIEEERKQAWYIVGITFGFALLAKLQAILLVESIVLMLLLRPKKRHIFTWKEPYLACLIGLAIFTPVLYWNWQNHWATFVFSIQHGIHHKIQINQLLTFWSGQLGVFSFIFLALIYYTFKNMTRWNKISTNDAFLIGCFLPVFGFFSFTSLTYTALANWPAIAYLPAIVFLAGQFYKTWQNARMIKRTLLITFLSCSFLISLCILIIARYPGFFINTLKIPLPNSIIIINHNFGWDQTAHKIDDIIIHKFPIEQRPVPIFCDGSYQTASEMQFYLKRPVMVLTTRQARHSQFDYILLKNIKDYDQKAGLLVLTNPLPANATNYFRNINFIEPITIQHFHHKIRRLKVYYFQNLNAPALYKMALHKPLGYPGTYPE